MFQVRNMGWVGHQEQNQVAGALTLSYTSQNRKGQLRYEQCYVLSGNISQAALLHGAW